MTLKDGSVSTLVVLDTPNEQNKFKVNLIEITEPNSKKKSYVLRNWS